MTLLQCSFFVLHGWGAAIGNPAELLQPFTWIAGEKNKLLCNLAQAACAE